MPALQRWSAVDADGFHWRHWDDERVLYHRASGGTHRVDAFTEALLRSVVSRPADIDVLSDELSTWSEDGERDLLKIRIRRTLARLEQLGLVEPRER